MQYSYQSILDDAYLDNCHYGIIIKHKIISCKQWAVNVVESSLEYAHANEKEPFDVRVSKKIFCQWNVLLRMKERFDLIMIVLLWKYGIDTFPQP